MAVKKDEAAQGQPPSTDEQTKTAGGDIADAKAKAQADAQAEAARTKAAADEAHLVTMTKADATIKVHPSCVADHKRCGWKPA